MPPSEYPQGNDLAGSPGPEAPLRVDGLDYYHQVVGQLDSVVGELSHQYRDQMACKPGCFGCCIDGFKIRWIEGLVLLKGYGQLPTETAQAVIENLRNQDTTVLGRCPMLVEGCCSVYPFRPALCRAFGVVIKKEDQYATCELNFQNIDQLTTLDALDLHPYYEILNDLSRMIWQANPHRHAMVESMETQGDDPPLFSIRELMTIFLRANGVDLPDVLGKTSPVPGQKADDS